MALAFGCARGPEAPRSPAQPVALGELRVEPCTYTAEEIEYAAECGWLGVPENRAAEGSRTLQLPVLRVHATGADRLEPIYYLAGGPGQSNLAFERLEGLIGRHDFVFVGYRGVDGPVRLDCPEYQSVLRDPPGGLLGPETWDASVEAYRSCADRWRSSGVDLAGYTVTETIADLEAARKAWGDTEVNTLSQSYGTRLAMLWAWMHPDALHRSALISVNPPGHFIWSPETIERQLAHYSALCSRDAGCSERTGDLAAAMRRVSRDMPERWLFLPVKRDNVLLGTFMLLYHTTTAPRVFDAWLDAAAGDASGLAVLSLMTDLLFPSAPVSWGESVAMVTSTDYVYEPGRDYVREMMPEHLTIGAPASGAGFAGARGWPGNLIDESLRQVQASSSEMLLISGSVDFSTPAEFATRELLPALENGHQVILEEFGHTGDVWGLQPDATRHLLATWFAEGVVDESLFEPQPFDFDSGLGLGTVAKLALTGTVLAVALLGFAGWWLARRLRRRLRTRATSG